MKAFPEDSTAPLRFNELPPEIQAVCTGLLYGLKAALNDNLYGVYLYGAMVFPETRYIQDIDFHVIVKRRLSEQEKEAVKKLHAELVELNEGFPHYTDELDGYYILLSDAKKISTPWHQVYPDIPDESWPLHIAHMRAGYCIVLYGPDAISFLPEPAWQDLMAGLESVLKHTLKYLDQRPDYCTIVFCRLLYSYNTKDVVISKRSAVEWTSKHFPEWRELVDAALWIFEREGRDEDMRLVQSKTVEFYRFLQYKIKGNIP